MTSELKVDKITPASGTNTQIGDSGDTITIPAGCTITNSGTASGFGLAGWSSNSNNLLPASASSGIYLGTNSATATRLLNDYEEGTFTPNWGVNGGNASFSSNPSTNLGQYVKIGKFVHIQIYTSQINSSGTTGVYTVDNLPFTNHSSTGAGGGGREYGQTGVSIAVWVDPNSTLMKVSKYDATFTANSYLILSATYRTS